MRDVTAAAQQAVVTQEKALVGREKLVIDQQKIMDERNTQVNEETRRVEALQEEMEAKALKANKYQFTKEMDRILKELRMKEDERLAKRLNLEEEERLAMVYADHKLAKKEAIRWGKDAEYLGIIENPKAKVKEC